jgi:hypothetical protein
MRIAMMGHKTPRIIAGRSTVIGGCVPVASYWKTATPARIAPKNAQKTQVERKTPETVTHATTVHSANSVTPTTPATIVLFQFMRISLC